MKELRSALAGKGRSREPRPLTDPPEITLPARRALAAFRHLAAWLTAHPRTRLALAIHGRLSGTAERALADLLAAHRLATCERTLGVPAKPGQAKGMAELLLAAPPFLAAEAVQSGAFGAGGRPGAFVFDSPPPGTDGPPSREAAAPAAPAATPAAVPAEDPPRTAYGLLSCPESVVAEQEMELVVGLSRTAPPGVAGGPLERPESSVGPYDLTVQVIADGFTLRQGESFRQQLRVTVAAPYPTVTLHLAPAPQTVARQRREVHAVYTVDGQPLGFAVRYLTVTRRAPAAAPVDETAASGTNFAIPAAATAHLTADLTVVIRRQSTSTALLWSFESPHALDLPAQLPPIDIGAEPQTFAQQLMAEMEAASGSDADVLPELLRGLGREIAEHMPRGLWPLLRQVAAQLDGRLPTVLILSQEPFVPWELAWMESPLLDDRAAPYLGAQTVAGRWVQPDANQTRPALPPPTAVEIAVVGLVSGAYGQDTPRLQALPEAKAEAKEIARRFAGVAATAGGVQPIAARRAELLTFLRRQPGADLMHFSVHGRFDREGTEDGLLLADGRVLSPSVVRGLDLRNQPFVFLNACQVGQGNQLLGSYAGMAQAFLFAGAAAVVAPLWSIDDGVARTIAVDFYRSTLFGEVNADAGAGTGTVAPAEALRRVRAAFTPEAASPTCLSYQFFGHPALRLAFKK